MASRKAEARKPPRARDLSRAFGRARKEFERRGALLVSDAVLPSVAGALARAPLVGSWWAHPQAHEIFMVAKRLGEEPDVLTVRLFNGKFTFLHRRHWRAFVAVARARQSWQMEGLSPLAKKLLRQVEISGTLRNDALASEEGLNEAKLGGATRELERRLLVYTESLHTERGAHTKRLQSWQHLIRRLKFAARPMTPALGKAEIERVAREIATPGRSVRLPWPVASR
jgi:hypothetical protein